MTLTVTAIAAAICALLLIYCAFATVKVRFTNKIAFGDGENHDLLVARRIHANLAEHAPFFLIMLGLLEMSNASHLGLTIVAGLFLIARVLHIVGMQRHYAGKSPQLRQISVILTWVTMVALALWILFLIATVNL